ncbi:MAG: dihydroorotate dehydrogenase [Candidatus Omnitrophica bacterium]|nr:dihydroorotate dehydrogenase [Candidatus Omnitrophota bacterium]MBU4477574.1 dihydroorotate dehydrogenase [Candidatus Omnitrophota bacterium]MCG2703602.1 dihydroorotate dehydrogenase [Candidatus Omnitrophota bacterium]
MDLRVNLGRLKLKNPVTTASGTFGYGKEFEDIVALDKLGAVITKTITRLRRPGNPPPRLTETAAGILNAIGLQNEGLDDFIKNKLPQLKAVKTKLIVSVSATDEDDFVYCVQRLEEAGVEAVELNLSCPNIKYSTGVNAGKKMFAQDAQAASALVAGIRKHVKLVLITKLSPNVTDITQIARAVEDAGTDAVSLINTFSAMAIDIKTMRPKLANITGGLSGPAIKPVAVRMVYEVARAVKVPVLGMGGIMNAEDALEFILAGATAVSVGTANFVNPRACPDIINGLVSYCKNKKISSIKDIIGGVKV